MLSFFDLADDVDIGSFEASLESFNEHLIGVGLLYAQGNVGRRCSDTPMHTDDARTQGWFFESIFIDKAQCDRAFEYVSKGEEPIVTLHKAVLSKMRNGIFSCWEDRDGSALP
jgi:hypothetical protein